MTQLTDIKRKALELVNEVAREWRIEEWTSIERRSLVEEVICRAIERHEAFRQEVSDAAVEYNECGAQSGWLGFDHFIIPKPDPFLIEAREVCARVEEERNSLDWATRYRSGQCDELGWVKHIRAALAARGGRIEALEAENERLREALNPTNRRQAEYMNLFHWSEPDFDECGGRTTRHVSMPWPKIKQALAAIYARAALEEVTTYD